MSESTPSVPPNRADRIAMAEARLAEIKPEYEQVKRAYEDAERVLKWARDSFDVGEHVVVTETCRRGCCVELQFTGVVVAQERDLIYTVRRDSDGWLREHVFYTDMIRVSS